MPKRIILTVLAMLAPRLGYPENPYQGNRFLVRPAISGEWFSAALPTYSYGGNIEVNVPIYLDFAVRPSVGWTAISNNTEGLDVDRLDWGLEIALMEGGYFPIGLSVKGTRKTVYFDGRYDRTLAQWFYRPVNGHLLAEISKSFRPIRNFHVSMGVNSLFLFDSGIADGALGFTLAGALRSGPFLKLDYCQVLKERDNQHVLGLSVGVVIDPDEE